MGNNFDVEREIQQAHLVKVESILQQDFGTSPASPESPFILIFWNSYTKAFIIGDFNGLFNMKRYMMNFR